MEIAAGTIAAAKARVEEAVATRNASAERAISKIQEITSSDGLNDSWFDDWGADALELIAKVADIVATVAGVLALVTAFIPGLQALSAALLLVATVAGAVSALANLALAATGKKSWTEVGIAIATTALTVVGLGVLGQGAKLLTRTVLKPALGKLQHQLCPRVPFGQCFVAGTLIHTPDGPRPIEGIRAGDKVWSRNTTTGADELQLVNETFVRTTHTLYHLTIGDDVVTTTAEHPFMVDGNGWLHAEYLKPGDLLVTEAGRVWLDAVDVEHRAADAVETVHNIHVDACHTFYVLVGGHPVLVHNASHTPKPDGIPGLQWKPKDSFDRPTGINRTLTPAEVQRYSQKTNPSQKARDSLAPDYDSDEHEAGHILGALLGGPNKNPENFFIQHDLSNNPWQSHIEKEVFQAIVGHQSKGFKGGDMDYDVTLHYDQDNLGSIPDRVQIKADGNDYHLDIMIDNKPDMDYLGGNPDWLRNSSGPRFGDVGAGPAIPKVAP